MIKYNVILNLLYYVSTLLLFILITVIFQVAPIMAIQLKEFSNASLSYMVTYSESSTNPPEMINNDGYNFTPTHVFLNLTTPSTTLSNATSSESVFESKLIIPLYVIIFFLSVVGNFLVLVTLVRNKRMRTVTNVYLLNLVSIFFYLLYERSLIKIYVMYLTARNELL